MEETCCSREVRVVVRRLGAADDQRTGHRCVVLPTWSGVRISGGCLVSHVPGCGARRRLGRPGRRVGPETWSRAAGCEPLD